MTRYLIHNVYGDADDLVATAPADVECVPRLWDGNGEAYLINMLAELGISGVSCLPVLLYWHEDAHWAELRVADMPAPWTWAAIDAATTIPPSP